MTAFSETDVGICGLFQCSWNELGVKGFVLFFFLCPLLLYSAHSMQSPFEKSWTICNLTSFSFALFFSLPTLCFQSCGCCGSCCLYWKRRLYTRLRRTFYQLIDCISIDGDGGKKGREGNNSNVLSHLLTLLTIFLSGRHIRCWPESSRSNPLSPVHRIDPICVCQVEGTKKCYPPKSSLSLFSHALFKLWLISN